jgi:hypothetical protein
MYMYIHVLSYTYIIYIVKDNKIMLVSLSERTTGGRRDKKMLENENY